MRFSLARNAEHLNAEAASSDSFFASRFHHGENSESRRKSATQAAKLYQRQLSLIAGNELSHACRS